MKTKMSKRVLTLVLAIVLTFALGVSAFATWSSYQGRNSNNGTTSSAPTSSSPTKSVINLSTNGYAYSGVDTTPVIQGNNAYVLYNGGVPSGSAGGARLISRNVSTDATNWDIQLDADANNAQQLSTPYYDSSNNILYAGVTLDSNLLAGKTLSDWNVSPASALSSGTLTIPANTTVTLTYTGLDFPGDYNQAYFMTGIIPTGDLNGTVTLDDGLETYSYGTSYAYAGYEFGLYNNSGSTIPAGTYDVTITLNSNAQETTNGPITCTASSWRLYKITNLTSNPPTVTLVTSGAGQINTHINAGSSYLYFGIYEGDRCYWQVNPSNGSKIAFKPTGGEDFYWAGAARVEDYMVFGSESGKVYKRPIGATFGSAAGTVIDLTNYVSEAGAVRSSICYDGSNLYLTTRNGYLWKLDVALTTASVITIVDSTYVQYSTSTPVVSANGYIYVGGYNTVYDPNTWTTTYKGAIKAVPVSTFDVDDMKTAWYSGSEAVQSSVVVFSTSNPSTGIPVDYLYFTTNGATGKGYCASYVPSATSSSPVWDTSSEGTGYTLQGVAVSDNGTVVFGNDDNELYIVK